ncbi:SDR family NAD(P)-dependent oxidoreductase [Sinanaerobacter chloroacetimidivorans]|uniref:SDR family oxidoreductase n=1 Tax=Sinanaerobacter chloroacetimidivorans TaxID=2818044 RepID=A0A8J7W829_9FIRM|nr:SDR family NAD(P)-dependent oxidoreductase [Sinanaerobacter chloroacetimidivorans]MBR0600590.1 SDR family oxidoreductase [Sinanaerobacter chloroacetimidivorans]
MRKFDLQGKVALITGSGKGIGREIALQMAKAGARIVVTDVSEESGSTACQEIRSLGADAVFIPMDISNPRDVEKAKELTLAIFGGLDIIVCNAGITFRRDFADLTPEEFHKTVHINLTGTFNTIKGLLSPLIDNGSGKIILISSASAYTGSGGGAHYSATKAGQIGLARTLAKELGPMGINVNCIAPRTIVTEILDHLYPPGPSRDALIGQIPLRRIGMPEDIANAAVYLASEEACYVSGQTLLVDGART